MDFLVWNFNIFYMYIKWHGAGEGCTFSGIVWVMDFLTWLEWGLHNVLTPSTYPPSGD